MKKETKLDLVELEYVEPTNVSTVFECSKCGTVSENPDMRGCSQCGGNFWISKFKEVVI